MDMSDSQNAFQFWTELIETIIDELNYGDYRDDLEDIKKMERDSQWYPQIKRLIKRVFSKSKNDGLRIVIAIDEFDAVSRLFGDESAYYQLLRTLFSSSKYSINGVIVSRRNLEALEAKATDISTFHGVFRSMRLLGFNDDDMAEYYEKLEDCGLILSDSSKEQLDYFTGKIPYLCCIFADRMLFAARNKDQFDVTDDTIVKIYREELPSIESYYRDLVDRLDEDGHLEPLVYLAFDDMRTLSYHRTRQNMISMGYLNEDVVDGVPSYYAYSRDFMSYLKTRSLDLPIWDLLSSSEKKLKRLFDTVYPEFNQVTYSTIQGPDAQDTISALCNAHPELGFRWTRETNRFLNSACSYRENPSVLDILPVTFIIQRITGQWERAFEQFFDYDQSWKDRLLEIEDIRNPVAHAQEEYIDENKMTRCKHYLEEFLKLDLGIE